MNLMNSVLSIFAKENCVTTALFGEVCDACNGGGVNLVLMYTVEVMILGIGILSVIGLMVFGLQYLTAGSNAEQVAKAKNRLVNMVIGVVTYAILVAVLQFLMPGGVKGLVVTPADQCPEVTETKFKPVDQKLPDDDVDTDIDGSGGGGRGRK